MSLLTTEALETYYARMRLLLPESDVHAFLPQICGSRRMSKDRVGTVAQTGRHRIPSSEQILHDKSIMGRVK